MAAPARKDSLRDAATAARLAVLDLPKGGFTGPARTDALARLTEMGLPVKRDEYWRYTDPVALSAPDAPDHPMWDTTESPVQAPKTNRFA